MDKPRKKVLCVGYTDSFRSLTTAKLLHDYFGYDARACGVSPEFATTGFDADQANWADEIVAVHPSVAALIHKKWFDKVVTLNIPDIYPTMDNELSQRILSQYTIHSGEQIEDTTARH